MSKTLDDMTDNDLYQMFFGFMLAAAGLEDKRVMIQQNENVPSGNPEIPNDEQRVEL